jgi:hypothetical protein
VAGRRGATLLFQIGGPVHARSRTKLVVTRGAQLRDAALPWKRRLVHDCRSDMPCEAVLDNRRQ